MIFLDMYTFVRMFKKVTPRGPDQIYYLWSMKNYNVRQNLVFKGTMDEVEDFLKDDYDRLPDGTYREKMKVDNILWLSKAPNKCNSDQIRNVIVYTGALHSENMLGMLNFINNRYGNPFEISRYVNNPFQLIRWVDGKRHIPENKLCIPNLYNYGFWANKNTIIDPADIHDDINPQSVRNVPRAFVNNALDDLSLNTTLRPKIKPGPIYRVPDEELARRAVGEGGGGGGGFADPLRGGRKPKTGRKKHRTRRNLSKMKTRKKRFSRMRESNRRH